MGTFHKYYTGEKVAPILTLFVGGNHEASGYMWELYHGGWVAPNIYFLGFSNVVRYGGLRIGGISGIFKAHEYQKGYTEHIPFTESSKRSIYHVREIEVEKLSMVEGPIDLFVSHDWPRGIEQYGDVHTLLRWKRHFQQEIQTNTLGSFANERLLQQLRPSFWFSAHLHVKFAAVVQWVDGKRNSSQVVYNAVEQNAVQTGNPDEIDVDLNMEEDAALKSATGPSAVGQALTEVSATSDGQEEVPRNPTNTDSRSENVPQPPISHFTRFLALDKCLPNRDFLQIIEVPSPQDDKAAYTFEYDQEWLAIVKCWDTWDLAKGTANAQNELTKIKSLLPDSKAYVEEKCMEGAIVDEIPRNFCRTAPADQDGVARADAPYVNPQTVEFCELIGIKNRINADGFPPLTCAETNVSPQIANPDEIDIDLADDDEGDAPFNNKTPTTVVNKNLASRALESDPSAFKDVGSPPKRTRMVLPSPKFNSSTNHV